MRALAGSLCVLVAACSGMQGSTGSTNQVGGVVTTTSVTVVTGGFAAMDEIPVEGGELRLAVPQISRIDGDMKRVIGFPLKHTHVAAKVGGMMSVYEIEQTFENPFDEPLEAVYVFPLGADGAVSGYELIIGERTITGEIQTKERARKMYDDAKSAGHTAGIIEQNKPNIFTQRIANIAPRETIKVKIHYTELLDYNDGQYTMAVPITIGPRYLPEQRVGNSPVGSHAHGSSGRAGVTSIPYIDATRSSSTLSFSAEINAGVPIVAVDSPSHDIAVQTVNSTTNTVTLARKDEIPNRDLVIKYKTAGPTTTVGMLAHRIDNQGFFLLAVQPKAQYRTGDIRPREVVIVVDRSGSMSGVPLDQAKKVANGILASLTDRDSFNVVAFASGVESMSPVAVRGDAAGVRAGQQYLGAMQPGGGTEMEAGVQQMLMSTPANDRIRVVYFLTDGFVGNDDVVVGAAKKLLGTNRIFTVGVGSAPNRSLLDRLAIAGRGFPTYIGLTEDPAPFAQDLVKKSAFPYLTDVQIDWGGLAVEDVPTQMPDVYAGQPLVITGKYKAAGTGTVKVSAWSAGRQVTIPIIVALPQAAEFEPVASLWARRKIDELEQKKGYEQVADAVTQLGLQFHLVTDYTSFVAIDRTRVVSNGQTKVVEQPLVVPEGVDPNTTVGQGADATPSYSPPPSNSSSSRSNDDDDGGSWSGWSGGGGGSGGRESSRALVFALAGLLGAAWVLARRGR
jgi:Ca-activated chloride channel family protein